MPGTRLSSRTEYLLIQNTKLGCQTIVGCSYPTNLKSLANFCESNISEFLRLHVYGSTDSNLVNYNQITLIKTTLESITVSGIIPNSTIGLEVPVRGHGLEDLRIWFNPAPIGGSIPIPMKH